MRWFKFVGSESDARSYGIEDLAIPVKGCTYHEDHPLCTGTVGDYATCEIESIRAEWQEVTDNELTVTLDTGHVSNTHDTVNHPAHYNQGEVECIEAIKSATINKTGIEAVCVGNVIKYLWRYEEKGGVESVKKAKWYLERLIKELEK